MSKQSNIAPAERIERGILLIRGHRVLLSPDLAKLYAVETRALVQAVKRNLERFPGEFMFQLTPAEFANLKSQIVTSNWGGAERAGVILTVHGKRLTFDAPAGAMTPDLRVMLTTWKPQALAVRRGD